MVEDVPVKVDVVVEALSQYDDRPVSGEPKLATQPDEIVLAEGAENLGKRRSVHLGHMKRGRKNKRDRM